MELESEECREKLRCYEVKNDSEKMAIEVLICDVDDVVNVPGIQDLSNEQIDDLAEAIRRIRKDIGVDD